MQRDFALRCWNLKNLLKPPPVELIWFVPLNEEFKFKYNRQFFILCLVNLSQIIKTTELI